MTEPTPRDLLAEALCHEYHPMHWDVAYGNRAKPCQACVIHAARLLASPALDALVAERVAALAEGHAALVGLARGMFPTADGLRDPEAWAYQAAGQVREFLAAALTERRPS